MCAVIAGKRDVAWRAVEVAYRQNAMRPGPDRERHLAFARTRLVDAERAFARHCSGRPTGPRPSNTLEHTSTAADKLLANLAERLAKDAAKAFKSGENK